MLDESHDSGRAMRRSQSQRSSHSSQGSEKGENGGSASPPRKLSVTYPSPRHSRSSSTASTPRHSATAHGNASERDSSDGLEVKATMSFSPRADRPQLRKLEQTHYQWPRDDGEEEDLPLFRPKDEEWEKQLVRGAAKFIRDRPGPEIGKVSPFLRTLTQDVSAAPSLITDHIVIGGQNDVSNFACLQQLGITHILNVTTTVKNVFPQSFAYFRISMEDSPR